MSRSLLVTVGLTFGAAACGFEGANVPRDGDVLGTTDASAASDGALLLDAPVAPLLFHDFEGAFLGPFTNTYVARGDVVRHADATGHSGTRSAACETNTQNDNQATLFYDLPGGVRTEGYVGFWVRLTSGFPPDDFIKLVALVNDEAGWRNVVTLNVYPDLRLGVRNGNVGAEVHYSTATVAVATWHHVELRVRIANGTGRLALALDGVMQFDEQTLDTGEVGYHRVLTGIAWQGDPDDATRLFLDDVTID